MNDWMDAETRVERAHDLYERGRWVEAAAELRAAIEINPYNASWYFNLGLTLEALEDFERACDAYTKALELESNDVETLNCLGINLTRLGRFAEALESFRRIEQIDATHEGCYCNRIITYTELGDHDKAELMFYMARNLKDECPLCYYNVGNSLFARALYDRAIDCWRQTLRLDASHPQAHLRIAEAYWAKGDLAEARKHFESELERDEEDIELLLDYGELLVDLEEYAKAAEVFHKVLHHDADNVAAVFYLGEISLHRGKYATAEQRFRKVLAKDVTFPDAHLRLAEVLIHRGSVREAVKHLSAEQARCGDDAGALQEIAQLLLEANCGNEAHTVLRRLIRLQPDNANAEHNLAVSCFMTNRLEEGIVHCRRALKIKADYPLALYNLALAHLKLGQPRRSQRYAARALTLAPQDRNIRRLCRQLGLDTFWRRLRDRLLGRQKQTQTMQISEEL